MEIINIIGLILSIITIIISIIVFTYQYKQNYTQNVFNMINNFQNTYEKLEYPVKTTKNGIEITNFLKGNEVIHYIFRKIMTYDGGANIDLTQYKNNEDKFRALCSEWKKLRLSKIDNLVRLSIFIGNYQDRIYFDTLSNQILNIKVFRNIFIKMGCLPNNFNSDYNLIKDYFKLSIFSDFKLLVLLFNLVEEKEIYKKFLSSKHFGALNNEDFSYFFRGNTEYCKYVKEKVLTGIKEFNNNIN